MRHTVASIKAAVDWESVLNMSPTDRRWLLLLNQTMERFANCALWDRLVQRYQICANKSCITWPRQIMTLEVADVCNRPVPLKNQWYEFLENGPGRLSDKAACQPFQVLDRGRGYVMFDDLVVASKIRLYPQFASDIGKKVTIRGYNSAGLYVLTNGGQTVGETVTLQAPYVDTNTTWMPQVFREVIKDPTNGYVRAYSYDATLPVPPAAPGENDTPLTALAEWEPTETLPDYRRSFIPALGGSNCNCSCGANNGCDKATVTVMAKLQFIPVSNDADFLPISNVVAIKLGMLACMLEERLDWSGAAVAMYGTFDPYLKKYRGGAIPALEDELDAFQGSGTVSTIRLEGPTTGRATLTNMI